MKEITLTVSDEDFAYFERHELRGELERAFAVIIRSHRLKNIDAASYVDAAGQMRSGTMNEAAVLETVAIEKAQKEQHARDFGNSGPDAVQLRARESIERRARNPLGHPEHGNNL
jgi:hypothetical protein